MIPVFAIMQNAFNIIELRIRKLQHFEKLVALSTRL